MLEGFRGKAVRALVVWEPVLATDRRPPTAAALGRIRDPRARQFWDKQRLISHSMGEHDRRSIVWDFIGVYPPGAAWTERPPEPVYHGRPVVEVIESARRAVAQALSPAR